MKEVDSPLEQKFNFDMLGRKLVKENKDKKLILVKDVRNQAPENEVWLG